MKSSGVVSFASSLLPATLAVVASLAASPALGQVDYVYVGETFTDVMGSYTMADRITGSLSVGAPLAADLAYPTDISGLVTSFTFSDGRQTLSSAGAEIVALMVGTDSGGNITEWSMRIWKSPIPSTPGALIDGIHSASFSTVSSPFWLVQDVGFQDGLCLYVIDGQCDGVNLPTADMGELFVLGDANAAGTWTAPIFADGFESGDTSSWSG